MTPNDSLEHYGIKGMRWGVRRTAEELGHVVNKAKKKVKSVQKKTAAKKKKMAQKKRKAEREAILRDPKKLYKHRNEFSEAEIKAALSRFAWEKQLKDYAKADVDRGVGYLKTMFSATTTGINVYNDMARIFNSLTDEKPMPYIMKVGETKKKDEDENKDKDKKKK